MKVYYVSSNLKSCYYVRCLLPLQANGWDGDVTSIKPHIREAQDKTQAAKHAEIVVFHRPDDTRKLELARILKGMNKKIVFDNDDTIKDDGGFKLNEFMTEERLRRGLASMNETIDAFVKEADLVTCSTEFLAEEYRKLNDKVVVIPNYIDPFQFDEPLRNETDIIRIGVTGSVAITSDLDVLRPILEHYQGDKRVQFIIFSMPKKHEDTRMRELYKDEYAFFDSINIEWQPFVGIEDYFSTLNELRMDMMIIPRAEHYFNRCKSNIKFLEASMLEIPCVVQSFTTKDSPYEQNPKDIPYQLFATDTKSWIDQIEKLIANKELRKKMGEDAHKYVLENYNIEDHANEWPEAYAKIWQK
jgi:glycosyltransferase involved in cell wall biosynthesis